MRIASPWGPGPRSVPGAAPRCPACQHQSPPRRCSLCLLPPRGAEAGWPPPARLREGGWGGRVFAPCCRCATLPSLRPKTGLGKRASFPGWFVTEGAGKLVFSPRRRCPSGDLGARRRPPVGPGRRGSGSGSGAGRGPRRSRVRKARSRFCPLLTASLGNHVLARCYNHWLHAIFLLY